MKPAALNTQVMAALLRRAESHVADLAGSVVAPKSVDAGPGPEVCFWGKSLVGSRAKTGSSEMPQENVVIHLVPKDATETRTAELLTQKEEKNFGSLLRGTKRSLLSGGGACDGAAAGQR